MLRTLLAERFKLVARTEMREQPVYALVLARADGRLGPNLRASRECLKGGTASGPRGFGQGADGRGAGVPPLQPGQQMGCGMRSMSDGRGSVIQGGARTIAEIARSLDGRAGRTVIDRTGLTGAYDVDLRFAPSNVQTAPGADSELPTLFTALQEQLGLKLESATGPVEYLVVDRIERPTPD